MKIIDVISNAGSEHEIRFLLTAYVDAVRYCSEPDGLAAAAYALPVGDTRELQARIVALEAELARTPDAQHGAGRPVMQETAAIFRAATRRLRSLEARTGDRHCMPA